MRENNALVVEECRVLLRVEHLKKRTRRISIVSSTDLVTLIDEHKRVLSTDALQCLNDLSRERYKHDYLSVTPPYQVKTNGSTYPT